MGRREHNDTSAGSVACSSESAGALNKLYIQQQNT